MSFLAVEGVTLQSNVTPYTIISTTSPGVKINNKGVYCKELKVLFSPGASHQTGGTLTQPVTVTISPSNVKGTKVDGELPLSAGDQNPSTDTGSFQVGNSTVTKPITVTITEAGQATANCT